MKYILIYSYLVYETKKTILVYLNCRTNYKTFAYVEATRDDKDVVSPIINNNPSLNLEVILVNMLNYPVWKLWCALEIT